MIEINADLLRKVLDIADDFVDAENGLVLYFRDDGMLIRQADASGAFMVHLFLHKSVFRRYEVPDEKVYINPVPIRKRLKRLTSTLIANVDIQQDRMTIEMTGRYGKRRYGFGIMESKYAKPIPPEPKVPLRVKVKMFSDALRDAVRDAKTILPTFDIEARKEPKRLAVYALEKGTFNSSWTEFYENVGYMEMEIEEDARATYNCDFVSSITDKAGKFSNVLLLQFSQDMPMKLEYQLPFEGQLYFWVCPYVEKK